MDHNSSSSSNVEEIVKKVLLLVYLLALCNLTLLAQTGKGSPVGHITETSAISVASQDGSGGWQTIYSNVGPPSHPYLISEYGYWPVSDEQVVAMAFTPSCDAYVTEVWLALEHVKGAKQAYISLYRDINGLPGGGFIDDTIEGPVLVTKIPSAGTKGGFTIADFLPVPVYKGQRYWVLAAPAYAGPGTRLRG